MDIIEIRTALIDEDKDQPRNQFDEASLQELISSIAELGLLSPIKVRKTNSGRYQIIYGNRRYKACLALNLPTIPCIISEATDKLEIYLEQIAENLTRESFSPLEEAEAFDKVLTDPKFNSSIKYLSSKLGKPETYIKHKCELLKFGAAVKKRIINGTEIRQDKLTEEQLMAVKDLPVEYRDSLALIIAKDALSVSDARKIARLFKDPHISTGTKGKLLFKTGRDLLETWSTYELNKAERAKPSERKEEKRQKPGKEAADQVAAVPVTAVPVAAVQVAADQVAVVPVTVVHNGTTPDQFVTRRISPLEDRLKQLLFALDALIPLSAETMQSYQEIHALNKANFHQELDKLIIKIEQHLAEWNQVKQLATEQTRST